MVFSIGPYSCLLFKIRSAYADWIVAFYVSCVFSGAELQAPAGLADIRLITYYTRKSPDATPIVGGGGEIFVVGFRQLRDSAIAFEGDTYISVSEDVLDFADLR
jgi:hypothetical protein